MIIKTKTRQWDALDITYKQRRELHKKNTLVVLKDPPDMEAYFGLLEEVGKIAGYKEEELDKLTMNEVDELLVKTLQDYLGLSKKK